MFARLERIPCSLLLASVTWVCHCASTRSQGLSGQDRPHAAIFGKESPDENFAKVYEGRTLSL